MGETTGEVLRAARRVAIRSEWIRADSAAIRLRLSRGERHRLLDDWLLYNRLLDYGLLYDGLLDGGL